MIDAPPETTETTREEFLTARQLAAVLQVSERTVQRLAREGRIPAVRITKRIMRFHLQNVRQALDAENRPRPRRTGDGQGEDSQLSFTELLWQLPAAESHQEARTDQKHKRKRAASLEPEAARR